LLPGFAVPKYAVKSRYDSIAGVLQLDQVVKQLQKGLAVLHSFLISSLELGEHSEHCKRLTLVRSSP